ncbi:hypothetical protein Q8F55_005251 [Vanrija albida]|uniref:DASH complex subunit DUO1 n=1 Tax=Vanrija albida TaxID=181172 RepID=A0ABR3Q142_9TREE
MDSPFLARKGALEDDGSLVLADLSIVSDDAPDSPLRPGAGPSRVAFAPAPASAAPTPLVPARSAARPRFSLFAPASVESTPSGGARAANEDDGAEASEQSVDVDVDADAPTPAAPLSASAAASRDERLRASLAELRAMNGVFDGFLTSLENAKAHNERLATRVNETRTLLDTYVRLVGQTHHTQRLLLNPKWTGAAGDAAALAAAEAARIAAAEEAARVAEEERAAAQRRAEEEEEAARRAEAAKAASRGAPRGRGIARGRGVARGASASGIPSRTVRPTSAGSGLRRPASGAPASAVSTTAGGMVGRYGHVQSSGYGPRPRGS